MPQTDVYFYQEKPGDVPVADWLYAEVLRRDRRAYRKCIAAVERLRTMGYELRRPEADLLRDGIYELRVRLGRVNYRILYFFHGRSVALLAHGLTKEREVPAAEIDRAVERRRRYESDPEAHRCEPENQDG